MTNLATTMIALQEPYPLDPPTPDEIAEAYVDVMPQQRFDAFAPAEDPETHQEKIRKLAAQSVVRVTHALDAVVVGPSVYVSSIERERRNKERTAVGLKSKH